MVSPSMRNSTAEAIEERFGLINPVEDTTSFLQLPLSIEGRDHRNAFTFDSLYRGKNY